MKANEQVAMYDWSLQVLLFAKIFLLASLESVEVVVDLGSLAMQRHTMRELSVVIRFLHDSSQIHHSRKT